MTCSCSDVERFLPELLDGVPEGATFTGKETRLAASDLDAHLKSCPACSDLVSDLKLIASEARQLAATEEPAPRVWVRIAAELRAEGLIRESAPLRPIIVPTSPGRRWTSIAWWLAPVAAVLLAAGSYVVSHKPAPQVAKQQSPKTATEAPLVAQTPATSPAPVVSAASPSVHAPAPQQLAQKSAPPARLAAPAAESEPRPDSSTSDSSTEDQQFLSAVSTLAPSMRASYENQLQAVNADIRETQAYVNQNPGDVDARQHLMDAYQQKALLYRIALDRIQ
jgi:hypothetical protein